MSFSKEPYSLRTQYPDGGYIIYQSSYYGDCALHLGFFIVVLASLSISLREGAEPRNDWKALTESSIGYQNTMHDQKHDVLTRDGYKIQADTVTTRSPRTLWKSSLG